MTMLHKLSKAHDAFPVCGEIPVEYIYTAGVAGERFLSELRDKGRIMGARCKSCQLVIVPPRLFCERCFEELVDWLPLSNRGTVETFSIVHVDMEEGKLKAPALVAAVKLDGADSTLIHCLGGVKPEDVEIGMRVEAVIKPRKERKGSILDISHFKPI